MEGTPDRFDVALRTWVAEDRIVRDARRLTEQHGLDPALVEDVEEGFRGDDPNTQYEALTAFLVALRVATT